MMNKYTVVYLIKANGTMWTDGKYAVAHTAAEAEKLVKNQVKATEGRHAFHIKAVRYEEGLTINALKHQRSIEANADAVKHYGEEFRHYLDEAIAKAHADGMTVEINKNGGKVTVREKGTNA